MSDWPKDILDRVGSDFPEDQELVQTLLDELEPAGVPERLRVARCILHLADGDLEEFGNMHQTACKDYRDVIWWAEYDHPDNPDTQIRDLRHKFE